MPFVKGKSGNPAGRPKGILRRTFLSILTELTEMPEKPVEFQHPDFGCINDPVKLAVMIVCMAAANGESWAVREILDRAFGKPVQSVDVTGESEKVLWINYLTKPVIDVQSTTIPTQDNSHSTSQKLDSK